jgi:predicted ester cyclase
MSTETNKALTRRFHEYFDKADWDGMRAVISPSVVSYYSGAEGPQDFDAFAATGKRFLDAFSQSRHVVLDQVAEGDRVASRMEWSAVHTGNFNGIPATGRPIKMEIIVFDRVADGRIVEHRGFFDMMGLLGQIGAMPGAQAA